MTLISYMLRENEGERNAGSIGWDIPITQKFFRLPLEQKSFS